MSRMCGRKLRLRDPEEIVDGMISRIKAGLNPWFFFYDDNFGVSKKWARDLLHLIIAKIIGTEGKDIEEDPACLHCPNFKFAAQVSVKIARDAELVQLMARAHCDYVLPGMESIFSTSLESYDKKQDRRDIELCIKRFRECGIKVHGMFIVNPDTESFETIRETIAFAIKHGIFSLQFSILTPLPGAKLYQQMMEQERMLTRNWALYDGTACVFAPQEASLLSCQYLYLLAWFGFYLKPGLFLKYFLPTFYGFLLWHKVHGLAFLKLLVFGRSVS